MEIRKWVSAPIVASLVLAVLVLGCAPDLEEERPGVIRDDAYVQVMTDLMLLDASPPSGSTVAEREARADSLRSEILAAQGVTAREILDFVNALGSEAAHMESLWERITQRYDSARIANLRAETEARSELDGKLGDEARAGATGTTPSPSSTSRAADPPSPTPTDAAGRSKRNEVLQRAARLRPPASDTTVRPD